MRRKNDSVKIDQLHRRLKKTIPLLDVLHKEITNGKELVITSGKDGVHSAGSFHYVGKAYDFRRWAFDELNQPQKDLFTSGLNVIFPYKYFDWVLESDHFHCELDPKPAKLTDDDLDIYENDKVFHEMISDEKQPTKLPNREVKVPFYRRNGFKRILGSFAGLGGLILKAFPETAAVGEIVMYGGGLLGIGGVGHGLIKNRQKDGETKVDKIAILRFLADLLIATLRWIAGLIVKLLTKKKGN